VLAKGALFLGVGVALAAGRRARVLVVPLALLLAFGFGGLPPTGGALAKAAVKDELGAGIAAWCAALSAFGSTMLMLHFVHRTALAARDVAGGPVAGGLLLPWFLLGGAAVALPWVTIGAVADAAGGLWSPSALLPVLAGIALAAAWWRWGGRVPPAPAGDILVLMRRGAAPREAAGRALAWFEKRLRPWPAAGLSLLGIVLALVAAMAAGRE
jgi:hypothetical protein